VHEALLADFLSLVQRELNAQGTRVLEDEAPVPAEDASTLVHPLPGGRHLVVAFDAPPPDREARSRRLGMLIESFPSMLEGPSERRAARPQPAHSLHEELAALAHRAGATDALVIDAHSPVVWGTAGEERDMPTRASRGDEGEASSDEASSEGARLELLPPLSQDGSPYAHGHRRGEAGAGAEIILLKPGIPAAKSLAESSEIAQMARHYGLALVERLWMTPQALELLPRALCQRHRIVPVEQHGATLVLAMADPQNAEALYDVVRVTGLDVEPVVAGESMRALLERWPGRGDTRSYAEVIAGIDPEARSEREARAAVAREAWQRHLSSRRAIAAVRELPEMETLHKGGHLHHSESDGGSGFMARSFAAIYVLILVFDGPFDELRAKRAMMNALPTVERLVLALPPLDPTPMAGAAAMRPRRRR